MHGPYDPTVIVFAIIAMLIIAPFYGLYKSFYPDPPNPWNVVEQEITNHCLTVSGGDRVTRKLTDRRVFYCKKTGKYFSTTKTVYVIDARTVPYKFNTE